MHIYTKKETARRIEDFIQFHNIQITLEEIQTLIYHSTSHHAVFQMWMGACDNAGLKINQEIIDFIMNCWNNFPHKDLGGKSPHEVARMG